MLLSLSSTAIDFEIDLAAIAGVEGAEAEIPAADELVRFTESVHRLDESLGGARKKLVAVIGEEGMVDAAIISSIFRGLNIAADSSGIRIDDDWEEIAASLAADTGANRYRTLQNSPNVNDLMDSVGQHGRS
ncbi:MAG: hypothetical protein P8J01_06935 [Acidimicrobiales bacterium]|nr:hypothetical protein [Acidimicrobiales bacterium]